MAIEPAMTRGILMLGVVATAMLMAAVSRADDKAVCLEATERGQSLRASHKLVEARKQFLACARPQCPTIVQQTCGGWLTEIEKSLPSVVITAKDAGGADLVDVTVTVDGAPFVTKLDGEAVPVDPGRHVFRFSTAAGTTLERPAVIKEGAKDQGLAVVLGNPAAAQGAPWKTVGWALGGVGVVGLVVGAISGGVAISENSSAHCDATGHDCLAGPLSSARSAATASDVGFIAGGILVAGGAALVLLSPKPGGEGRTATVRVVPSIGAGGGGVGLAGSF
jgi:hypothetical protein